MRDTGEVILVTASANCEISYLVGREELPTVPCVRRPRPRQYSRSDITPSGACLSATRHSQPRDDSIDSRLTAACRGVRGGAPHAHTATRRVRDFIITSTGKRILYLQYNYHRSLPVCLPTSRRARTQMARPFALAPRCYEMHWLVYNAFITRRPRRCRCRNPQAQAARRRHRRPHRLAVLAARARPPAPQR